MKEVFKEIPFGIEHTLKVLKNAEDIMKGENIGEEEKEFISIIAILHDIGAVEAQKKYGSIDGVYQEKEGPAVAKEILKKVGYNKNIDRICFIIFILLKTTVPKRQAKYVTSKGLKCFKLSRENTRCRGPETVAISKQIIPNKLFFPSFVLVFTAM